MSSGNKQLFLVDLWGRVYEAAGRDEWNLFVIGSFSISFGVFILMNLFFGCLDIFGLPNILLRFKIQKDKNVPVSRLATTTQLRKDVATHCFRCLDIFGLPNILLRFKIQKDKNVPMNARKYLWTLLVATFNITVMVLATLLILWHMGAKDRMKFSPSEMPTVWKAIADIIFCVILNDIGFYYLHRLLHYSPFLYKHIHKMHHDWKAPCSLATFYCHPIEMIVVNLSFFVGGPVLIKAHFTTAWFYWVMGQLSTTVAHSGYHFPFLPSSQAHDYHHHKSTDQYSTLGILDWLHGTNKNFKKSQNCRRHFIFCSLKPADELVKS